MPLKMDKRTTDKYGQLPIYFIPNKGQLTDNRIHYYAQSAGCGGFFTKEGASFVFREKVSTSKEDKEGQGFRLDFRLLHANQGVKPVIRGEIPGTVNYFKGKNPEKGHTNISMFQEVVYPKIWPGVDLVFRGEQGQIKYEFVLQPGAKVEDIRFTYEGAEELSLDEDGNLLIATPFGMVMDTLPVSYQMKDGRYHNVESAFRLTVNDKGEAGVTFSVGKGYDSRYPLIIDPGLVYSTYLGGNDSNQGNSIAVDNAGNAYIVGTTFSANFPTTTGAFQTSNNGFGDVFVTKFDPSGTALVYSTYLGGTTSFDQGWDVAVDNAGNAYVTGVTFSTDFPTTPGAFQSMPQGFIDAFVTKLNSTGTALVYSTYLGGNGF
ncbi:DUF7948 domain-containing protein [Sporosarcina sp. FSL K6-3457]|uniref:DUF7948 domain-containing protein n=1 Tax=Sporosarcina sp. FSL K6-3457 TaxID=2978204 RepID=UPI0030FAC27A